MSTLERFALETRRLARRAGAAILEIYAGSFAVEHKSDDSPLTAADMASHRVIVDGLHALAPDIPVLSEESKSIAWETRRAWQRYWLVDPLDGTRVSFTDNIEFTTVNTASFSVHPIGGAPIKGNWGLRMGVLNFAPAEDLQPGTTYEVVIPKGGITDLVRNPIAEDFKSTFTTH